MATTKNCVVIEQHTSNDDSSQATQNRVWGSSLLSNIFRDKERLVVLKIDLLLLTWAFISGLTKVGSPGITIASLEYNV
jgi:hypothetical protein